jgi:undecaprenyl-diphosphatase
MNVFQAGFLGIIQGFTEFLPVSSSGHLVILQSLIPGFSQPGVLFDVYLHFGSLLAVLLFYYKKILKLEINYLIIIVLASIPAAILGFILKDYIDVIFQSTKLVGIALIMTGVMNLKTDTNKELGREINRKSGFTIGLFQAFAILPGISRSGSTIFAGTMSGLKKEKAAEFSFLLSVPAIMGANILEIFKNRSESLINLNYIVGIICSFIFGFICIKIMLNILIKGKFKYFGYYCILLGLLSLFLK